MNLLALCVFEQRGECLADAIVIKLDAVAGAAAAHQLRRPQRVEYLDIAVLQSRRGQGHILIDRPPRDCQRVEKLPRARG